MTCRHPTKYQGGCTRPVDFSQPRKSALRLVVAAPRLQALNGLKIANSSAKFSVGGFHVVVQFHPPGDTMSPAARSRK